MELGPVKDAFDRVAKKQKLSFSKTQEVIDKVGREIEQAITKMNSTGREPDQKTILTELKTKLTEMGPINQLDGHQKELNLGLSKYAKSLDKCFNPDISKAYRNVDFDVHTVNHIVASHFYRQGLFDIGDCFIHESHESDIANLKSAFTEMYNILEAMRLKNLGPALSWASAHSDRLSLIGSSLEMKLHQLQFVETLQQGSRNEALQYARMHLAPLSATHKVEIQKLMACLLWSGRLDQSPYAEFLSLTHWEKLREELTRQFCNLLGQSSESPLSVVIAAGVQGLPTLLKLATLMANKKNEWQALKQLPVPVDLGKEFQFHSIFVCPVLREQEREENPPMLMPCGHVLSKQSIMKLSKNSTRTFKCPYCPLESTVSQCKQLHF